ncbi:hypothetical protein [Methylovirgula sp. HY1]|uniref:hypothetical protein n=1 Tax=Methylovirgula sp. HY1 TaxID=2822761 RepID=UPI001C5BC07C|nr:hypothetical protein [Methylovirgula sp. HY1]QXX74660.1 hypothetical protein MHY1_01476 [Methylovirgula sp. HY1]
MSRVGPIFLCVLVFCAGLAGSLLAAAPNDDSAVAAVFPPWWSATQSFAAAASAGDIRGSGALPFVLVVQSEHKGLNRRLYAAGALLLINPLGWIGCGQPMKNQNV